MEFIGKVAIFRKGVNIPRRDDRYEVYHTLNDILDKNGFDCRFHYSDQPIVIMTKRSEFKQPWRDFLNFFRWEQQVHGIVIPRVFPKRLFLGCCEGDEVVIPHKFIDLRLTCAQIQAQTMKFTEHNGFVPFETILAMEHNFGVRRMELNGL